MDYRYPSIQFEAQVDSEGIIVIPRAIAKKLKKGKPITVRLTEGVIPNKLRERSVTEDELEFIAGLQMERREDIICFLESEGILGRDKKFIDRSSVFMKRKK